MIEGKIQCFDPITSYGNDPMFAFQSLLEQRRQPFLIFNNQNPHRKNPVANLKPQRTFVDVSGPLPAGKGVKFGGLNSSLQMVRPGRIFPESEDLMNMIDGSS